MTGDSSRWIIGHLLSVSIGIQYCTGKEKCAGSDQVRYPGILNYFTRNPDDFEWEA